MLPSPGWGLGKAAPAPAGTTAVGAAALTLAPLGITTVEVPCWPKASCLRLIGVAGTAGGANAFVVVGKTVAVGIASCSRHFTSSALARSKGVWPSWFFRVGSAPWAKRSAHSWVLPFWAASCNGVKPHLSVALTIVEYLMRRAAMSRWPYELAL